MSLSVNDPLILAINPGSSSIKFTVYRITGFDVKKICNGAINGITGSANFTFKFSESCKSKAIKAIKATQTITNGNFYQEIEGWLNRHFQAQRFVAITCRIVHGGDHFVEPTIINDDVLDDLSSLIPLAPLHQQFSLDTLRHFMKAYPKAQHWACFDTAFHRTMPKVAQTFALPKKIRGQGVKPYGFHGLSYQSIINQLKILFENDIPDRIVIAHLGGGSSVCAILEGKSTATSMTFSPLDGLPMATRCGRLDPGAVLYMINQLRITPDEVSKILNKESGLAALSGLSGDIRELIQSTNEDAQFALEYFVNGVVRGIGEMIAILGGIDALVFTGGVGANSSVIRYQVCSHFQWLGLHLSTEANNKHSVKIDSSDSHIDIFSLETDEERVMATWVSTLMREQ